MRARLFGDDIYRFVLGGNATVTILNPETGTRFTYKVKAPRNRKDANIRFVSVLRGPNNESDYGYIGFIRTNSFRYGGDRASVSPKAKSLKAFNWFWRNMTNSRIEVYHEGKCGRCGRKLTVPRSISTGVGPECEKFLR